MLTKNSTGAKCLAASHIPRCRGLVLHDCHAEILATRAFNYWLLIECRGVLEQGTRGSSTHAHDSGPDGHDSPFVRLRTPRPGSRVTGPSRTESSPSLPPPWPPFELQPDIKVYMYCTCAPCGDASMELCMAAQDDPTPWEVSPDRRIIATDGSILDQPPAGLLDGRAHFSLLGIVRRKPARSDAESTRSKSCSDKLALRQVSSLLSFPSSLLVAPTRSAYLAGLVLPEHEISPVACKRSFSATGRMKDLAGKSWRALDSETGEDYGFDFCPFEVVSVPSEKVDALWPFGKPRHLTVSERTAGNNAATVADKDIGNNEKSKPGNISAVWVREASVAVSSAPDPPFDNGRKTLPTLRGSKTGLYETIVNGVKQGNRASSPTVRGASALCRAKMWKLLCDVSESFWTGASPSVDGGAKRVLHDEGWMFSPSTSGGNNVGGILDRIRSAQTYEELKRGSSVAPEHIRLRGKAMGDAKDVLKGWLPNRGDENWGLEVLTDTKKKARRLEDR